VKLFLWVAFRSSRMRALNILYPCLIATNVWSMVASPYWVVGATTIAVIIAVYVIVACKIVANLRRAAAGSAAVA
jgi:membrane protein DedA with SNARE-associated domain